VTNDGATILKAIGVDNPAAKVLVGKIHCGSFSLIWLSFAFSVNLLSFYCWVSCIDMLCSCHNAYMPVVSG